MTNPYQQLPWSTSGLELLSTIQQYIHEQGGTQALLEQVERELRPPDTCPDSYTKKRQMVIELYGNVPRHSIPELVDLGKATVDAMLGELMKEGTIRPAYIGHKGRVYRKKEKRNVKVKHQRTVTQRKRFAVEY